MMTEKLMLAAPLAMFGICAVQDWRRKEISAAVVVLFGAFGFGLSVFADGRSFMQVFAGMVPGAVLAALSEASRGQIGMGDGFLILAAGCYFGFWEICGIFFLGSLLAGLTGIFLLLFLGRKRNDRLPFAPFVLFSYILWLAGS